MESTHTECRCSLPPGWQGFNGWHFVKAGSDFCWKWGKWKDAGNVTGDEEVIFCGCQKRIRLPTGEVQHHPLKPNCIYANQLLAVERCEAYVAAINRGIDEKNLARSAGEKWIGRVKINPQDKRFLIREGKEDRKSGVTNL